MGTPGKPYHAVFASYPLAAAVLSVCPPSVQPDATTAVYT